MSSILIVPYIHDFEVKVVRVHTIKLKHKCEEKETIDVEKFDSTTIKMCYNIVLSFQTMPTRMAFTGALMFPYFDKCLTDNAFEEW